MSISTSRASSAGALRNDWVESLRAHHFRVTNQRLAVLHVLEQHAHSTVDDILAAVRASLPATSAQTIHGIVNDLVDAGMLQRIELAGLPHAARYETRVGDNHHHIVCVGCGRVEDVDCAVGAAPCLTPRDAHGMRVLEAQVTYLGICSLCERNRSDGKTHTHDDQRGAGRLE